VIVAALTWHRAHKQFDSLFALIDQRNSTVLDIQANLLIVLDHAIRSDVSEMSENLVPTAFSPL
jgi:hypothetical protein